MSSPLKTVSIRLGGDLGEHILGMRVLHFVRERYPLHEIVVYSDSQAASTQLDVVALSPVVSRVIPVFHSDPGNRGLETLRGEDLRLMLSSEQTFDIVGDDMFATASMMLDVPIFEILRRRPELVVPPDAMQEASRLLRSKRDALFVGMNFANCGADVLKAFEPRLTFVLQTLLDLPHVVILNVFASRPESRHRQEPLWGQSSIEEHTALARLSALSDRVLSCVDLSIPVATALLTRCRYFIGLNTGIKHLAWALGVPHSFFQREKPTLLAALRGMPDLHRMLLPDCPER